MVSPLSRAPKVPPENVLVLAGEADRITPIAHAKKLADHLGGATNPMAARDALLLAPLCCIAATALLWRGSRALAGAATGR